MPTLPNKPTFTRTLPPEGTHVARVIGFVYMGTITEDGKFGVTTNQKVRLTWELPDELHVFKEGEGAKPLVHSEEYNLVMGTTAKPSKIRPIIEGILGTSLSDEEAYKFDAESLVNMPCLISLKKAKSQKGADYMKLASTSKLMKGQTCKEAFNELRVFNYAEKYDEKYLESLPSFIKDKMKSSDEYKALHGITDEEVTDDLPF